MPENKIMLRLTAGYFQYFVPLSTQLHNNNLLAHQKSSRQIKVPGSCKASGPRSGGCRLSREKTVEAITQ